MTTTDPVAPFDRHGAQTSHPLSTSARRCGLVRTGPPSGRPAP
ncbi:hypothetical protein ACFYO1_16920 [Nocardia sp. NPDC006044]